MFIKEPYLDFELIVPRKQVNSDPILGNDFHVHSYRILRHPNVSYILPSISEDGFV